MLSCTATAKRILLKRRDPLLTTTCGVSTNPLTLLELQSHFGDNWGQITWNVSALSPKRDWSSREVKGTVGLGGRTTRSEQLLSETKMTTLLRDKVRLLKRWARFFGTLLTTKSPKFDPTFSTLFPQRPLTPSHEDEPTMDGMTAGIRCRTHWKAVGPDSLPAELLKIDHPECI